MELSELTAYAAEKYQIPEQHKWADFPGFSVLCHPRTGKWVALLMRQWDMETGTEIQRCDLKCGSDSLSLYRRPYLASPIRMHGGKWISIAFDRRTESDVVFQLFDKAITSGEPHGFTVVLGSEPPSGDTVYRETSLPFAGSPDRPPRESPPDRLRQMRDLYEYGYESMENRARNFVRQAEFMKDYEDDAPWSGPFHCYFPTYHDMNTRQLRGYFTWRTKLRKGDWQPAPTSMTYVYLYELLNDIGVSSPEEALERMRTFETELLDRGEEDGRMRKNLHRWMLEYAVLHDLPPETARQTADPEMLRRDEALSVLRSPDLHSDGDVFSALCYFGNKKMAESPVLKDDPEQGMRLFANAWRAASAYRWQGSSLFTLCFGRRRTRQWHPLGNAVYYQKTRPEDREYELNDCRSYTCKNGIWKISSYEKLTFDRARFQGFLHEADARFRRYRKTGRYLKESPADEWVLPYIETVIEEEEKARIEAARPKVTIDLSGLEQIRRDAVITRDSLLTEEEMPETVAPEEEVPPTAAEDASDLPLDPVQIRVLRALLLGEDPSGIIASEHLMPSIVADFMNEALFDDIGDTVILCEDDRLSLVEDYIEDLEQLIGG